MDGTGRAPINGTVDIGSGGSIWQDSNFYPVIGQAYYYAFYGLNSGTLEMGNNSLVAYYGGDTSGGSGKTRGIIANFAGFTVDPARKPITPLMVANLGHDNPQLAEPPLRSSPVSSSSDYNQTWTIQNGNLVLGNGEYLCITNATGNDYIQASHRQRNDPGRHGRFDHRLRRGPGTGRRHTASSCSTSRSTAATNPADVLVGGTLHRHHRKHQTSLATVTWWSAQLNGEGYVYFEQPVTARNLIANSGVAYFTTSGSSTGSLTVSQNVQIKNGGIAQFGTTQPTFSGGGEYLFSGGSSNFLRSSAARPSSRRRDDDRPPRSTSPPAPTASSAGGRHRRPGHHGPQQRGFDGSGGRCSSRRRLHHAKCRAPIS